MIIIGAPKGIPFVRALPNGQNVVQPIEVPPKVDLMGCRWIAAGGRYFIAWLSDDEIKLAAAMQGADGHLYTVCQMTSGNGLELVVTVDKLIRKSIEHLDEMQ